MTSVTKNLALWLKNKNIISDNDVEICKYGLEVFFASFLELASIFVISVIWGNFTETLLFFAAFIPLRIYVGGYHAETKLRCYIISLAVYFLFTFLLEIIPQNLYFTVNIFQIIFSMTVVLTFAPIVHHNKTINSIEKKHYRNISIIISVTESILIMILMLIFKNNNKVIAFSLGQLSATLSTVAAIIKYKLKERRKNSEKD